MDGPFRLLSEKTQTVFFTRKKNQEEIKLMMYGRVVERVGSIKFLGVILDARLTFAEHIKKIEDKCKKVIHVMRCLTGREWGGSTLLISTLICSLKRTSI